MTSVDARQKILAANEAAAAGLRRRFDESGTLVVNLISSPGSGKTSLLEATAARVSGNLRACALEADIATERDADRLRAAGLPAHQILTGGACHIDARQVEKALSESGLPDADILFIENVGNLICPTSFDLGEDFKIALLSVTEGDDKPFKYPGIFSRAAVTIITKVDLLPYVPFNAAAVRDQILTLNPTARVLSTSTRSGAGMEEWCDLLRERLREKRGVAATR